MLLPAIEEKTHLVQTASTERLVHVSNSMRPKASSGVKGTVGFNNNPIPFIPKDVDKHAERIAEDFRTQAGFQPPHQYNSSRA